MAKQITDFEFKPINKYLVDKVQQFHYHLFGSDHDHLFGLSFVNSLLTGTSFRSLILFENNKPDIVAISCFQTYGYIYSFGVHSNYRRLGLGKFMLKCTIECMMDMECIEASLNVNTNNVAAIGLYRSAGFGIDYHSIEELKGFYGSTDPMGPDAYEMQMRLTSKTGTASFNCKDGKKCSNFSVNEWNLVHRINGLLICIEPLCN